MQRPALIRTQSEMPARKAKVATPPVPGGSVRLKREASFATSAPSLVAASQAPQHAEGYYVNQRLLKSKDIAALQETFGPMPPGQYWYDTESGMWGLWGQAAAGFVEAGLSFPVKNLAVLPRHSSKGTTGVIVNGRELTTTDIAMLQGMGVACTKGKWKIDGDGNVTKLDDDEAARKLANENAEVKAIVKGFHKNKSRFTEFELELYYGAEQWETNVTYTAIRSFHRATKKLFPSLPLAKLGTEEACKKDLRMLDHYFTTVMQFKSVRENMSLLQLLHIDSLIALDSKSTLTLTNEADKMPLLALSEVNRALVGQMLVAISVLWGEGSETGAHRVADILELQKRQTKERQERRKTVHKKVSTKDEEVALIELLLSRLGLSEDLLLSAIASGTNHHYDGNLIGSDLLKQLEDAERWAIVWEVLLQAIIVGQMDARVHASLHLLAKSVGIPIEQLAQAEGECASCLQRQLIEMEKIKQKSTSSNRKWKIAAGAAIGGGALFLASLIALPLTISMIGAGVTMTAGAAAAMGFGAGISSGIVMAGGLLTMAAPMLPILFGTGGAALCGWKVHHITGGVKEFKFVQVRRKDISEGTHKYTNAVTYDSDDEDLPSEKYEVDLETNSVTVAPGAEGVTFETYAHAIAGEGERTAAEQSASESESESESPATTPRESPVTTPRGMATTVGGTTPKYSKEAKRKRKEKKKLQKKRDKGEYTDEETAAVEGAGMQVFICVNGWLWNEKEITSNWNTVKHLNESAEVYSLQYETDDLLTLGRFITEQALSEVAGQVAETLIPVLNAVSLPMMVLTAVDFVANPWSIVANHGKKAGKLLAQAIIARAAGKRPVSLVGWSLGARVIFSCLEELARMGDDTTMGLIENVFLLGAPVTAKKERWEKVVPLVAGRLVNVYSKTDWLMPWTHRCTVTKGKKKGTAGTQVIDVEGVENFNVSKLNGGHLNYRKNLKKILAHLNIHDSKGSCTQPKKERKLLTSSSQEALPAPEPAEPVNPFTASLLRKMQDASTGADRPNQ